MELLSSLESLSLDNSTSLKLEFTNHPNNLFECEESDFYVLLNPKMMSRNGLRAGDLVEVHPTKLVLPARPYKNIDENLVGLCEVFKEAASNSSGTVIVRRYLRAPQVLANVVVRASTASLNTLDSAEKLLVRRFLSTAPILQSETPYVLRLRCSQIIRNVRLTLETLVNHNECFSLDANFQIQFFTEAIPRPILNNKSLKRSFSRIYDFIDKRFGFSSLDCLGLYGKLGGVVFHGPLGSKIPQLVEACVKELGLACIRFRDILQTNRLQHHNTAKRNLETRLRELQNHQKTIVLVEDVDLLCPQKHDDTNVTLLHGLYTFIDMLDQCFLSCPLVLASALDVEAIHPLLRRPGRFAHEFEISLTSSEERLEIINLLCAQFGLEALEGTNMESLAEKARGISFNEIETIFREAAIEKCNAPKDIELSTIILRRFSKKSSSSARFRVPTVNWEDIGGQGTAKARLMESILWPMKEPSIFYQFGIRPPKGILLYGPPGCSKTLLAKAVATECCLNFFAIKGPEIFCKWVGDSEKAIANIFNDARRTTPSVVFIDELDAIGSRRDETGTSVGSRVLSQLLIEMDGIDSTTNILVLAATNRPDAIDPALMRPGRFDLKIYVALPDKDTRVSILSLATKNMPIDLESINMSQLADRCEGYSGAELVAVAQEAAFQAFLTGAPKITNGHFDEALPRISPQTTKDMTDIYDEFQNKSRFLY